MQTRWIAVLAGASLIAGLLTPWLIPPSWPSDSAAASPGSSTGPATPPYPAVAQGPRPRSSQAPAETVTPRGVIALGDQVIRDAAPCLESRGINVYPETIGTPEDLLSAVQHLSRRHAALVIHTGERTGLVDGQIQRTLDAIGADRRVVWSTIRVPRPVGGNFTFEDRTNASIRNVVGGSDIGRVLDWSDITHRVPSWTVDGIRISLTGCEEYAARVAKLSGVKRRG